MEGWSRSGARAAASTMRTPEAKTSPQLIAYPVMKSFTAVGSLLEAMAEPKTTANRIRSRRKCGTG
jgi:hypothetical protein